MKHLEGIIGPRTIIGTSTLNLPLHAIASYSPKIKDRIIGTRFLFPVYLIPSVEITRTIQNPSRSHSPHFTLFIDSGAPFAFAIKKMIFFLQSIKKKPYFYDGKKRNLLSHDEVEEIYASMYLVFPLSST